jgi:tetratricopeptide (TPR) repeat protein
VSQLKVLSSAVNIIMAYIPPAELVKREFSKTAEVKTGGKEQPLTSTFKLSLTSRDLENTNSLVAVENLVMNEPHFSDFFINGRPAGMVHDPTVLEAWILHIDDLLEKVETEISAEIDEFDISNLWLRKSTILCTMGNYEESLECAQMSLDTAESPLGYFRLGCALYCMGDFDRALSMMLQANEEDGGNIHIEHGLQVILARMRSRKDRPDIKNAEEDFLDGFQFL